MRYKKELKYDVTNSELGKFEIGRWGMWPSLRKTCRGLKTKWLYRRCYTIVNFEASDTS